MCSLFLTAQKLKMIYLELIHSDVTLMQTKKETLELCQT